MSNSEKYLKVFVDALEISPEEAEGLKYNSITNWDEFSCCTGGCFRYYDGYRRYH